MVLLKEKRYIEKYCNTCISSASKITTHDKYVFIVD